MIKPQTRLGRWSVGAATFVLLLLALSFSQDTGLNDIEGDVLWPQVLFWVILVFWFVSIIIAFFTGAISIIKNKERSILVFASTIIGLALFPSMIGVLAAILGLVP